jgi:hypothetical protein
MGIDPGSRITGYGIIDLDGPRNRYVASGCIQTAGDRPLPERLKTIFEAVTAVIRTHQPAWKWRSSKSSCTAIPIRRSSSAKLVARRCARW